jgi:hypothetical protein
MISLISHRKYSDDTNHRISFSDNKLSFNHKISIIYLISQILIWVGILTLVFALFPMF